MYAVAFRYGVAEVGGMDYPTLAFWYDGHLELTAVEESRLAELEALRNGKQ